jgi:hypothetical protein
MISLLLSLMIVLVILWIIWFIPFPPNVAGWVKPVVMLVILLFALLYFARGHGIV